MPDCQILYPRDENLKKYWEIQINNKNSCNKICIYSFKTIYTIENNNILTLNLYENIY